jgi:glycosyltransferase involved in cell wall biosynthesis
MKKLVFCIDTLEVGGAEKVLVTLLKELSKTKKYKLKLITHKETRNFLIDEIKENVDYKYLISQEESKEMKGSKNNHLKNFYYSYLKKRRFKKEIGEDDIIIDFLDGDFFKYLKEQKNQKIIWLHASIKILEKKKRGILNKIVNYDKVVTICDAMKKELDELLPQISKKTHKIYNPFDIDEIIKLSNKTNSLNDREKNLLEQDYIVSVSRLDSVQKDFFTLLKAFEKVKKTGIKEKLYIVGDGPAREEIEDQIKELNLEDEVKLLGLQKNPYIWMKNANLFVLVLVEAMILGKAVISTDCMVGPEEVLGKGKYGVLTKVSDENEMANKILKLLTDGKLRKKYEVEGKKSIQRFEQGKIVDEIIDMLEY